eukprot:scaffold12017_cov120-Isochrysis_galbana.AAC.1
MCGGAEQTRRASWEAFCPHAMYNVFPPVEGRWTLRARSPRNKTHPQCGGAFTCPHAMEYSRPSRAMDFVSPVTACLEEVYATEPGRGRSAEMEPLLMMRPPWG